MITRQFVNNKPRLAIIGANTKAPTGPVSCIARTFPRIISADIMLARAIPDPGYSPPPSPITVKATANIHGATAQAASTNPVLNKAIESRRVRVSIR